MTADEQKKVVENCAKIADCYLALGEFWNTEEALGLPAPYISLYNVTHQSENVTVYGYENPDAPFSERGDYVVQKDKSISAIAKIAKALRGRRDKVLDDDGMSIKTNVVVTHSDGTESTIKFEWMTNKEVTCSKKITGKKWIEPKVIDGHYEEEYEWECDEVVLLATPSE
jgi:hypothetical protein